MDSGHSLCHATPARSGQCCRGVLRSRPHGARIDSSWSSTRRLDHPSVFAFHSAWQPHHPGGPGRGACDLGAGRDEGGALSSSNSARAAVRSLDLGVIVFINSNQKGETADGKKPVSASTLLADDIMYAIARANLR